MYEAFVYKIKLKKTENHRLIFMLTNGLIGILNFHSSFEDSHDDFKFFIDKISLEQFLLVFFFKHWTQAFSKSVNDSFYVV